MNTIELRNELITRFSHIYLSKQDEEELLKASEDGKAGLYALQSEMDKKVEEWLKDK